MLPSIGRPRHELPRELEFVRELEAFEGPILSEYRAASGGGVYLEKWCAREGRASRWLLVRSEQRPIAEYLGGRMSMLRLLSESSDGNGFLVDRLAGDIVAVSSVSLDEIPQYLPKPTAFHDETLRPEWDTTPQSYLLDANWDAKLLSDIERIYKSAAGFAFFTQPGGTIPFPDWLRGFHFDGGFPIMHVFNHLRASMPNDRRPRSSSVAANSPGVFTIEAPTDTAQELKIALEALPRAEAAYDVVQSWARLRPDHVSRVPSTARENISRLATILNVDADKILPPALSSTNSALLVAGKLLASYYRMLWRVVSPSDRAEFLGVQVAATAPLDDPYDFEDEHDE